MDPGNRRVIDATVLDPQVFLSFQILYRLILVVFVIVCFLFINVSFLC